MHLDMARDHCYDDDDGDDQEEEGYIDMDVSSAAAKEFEFQMVPSRNLETGHSYSASPADEIFYKGKLLPLHLPPRLQMVETLLLQKPDGGGTPFASCDVSPATSCYVSGELDPEGFFFFEEEEERSGSSSSPKEGLAGGARTTKGSWARKLRSIKQSSLGLKLKASKAYIQSLFAAKPSPPAPKPKERSKSGRLIKRGQKEAGECGHRRSFSGTTVSKRRPSSSSSSNKFSSSSSSSCSSSNSSSFSSLKRSSSVSSDKECSIQGAIAYCKRSQQVVQASLGRKSVSDVESYLKSEPTGIDADAEREEGKRERRD